MKEQMPIQNQELKLVQKPVYKEVIYPNPELTRKPQTKYAGIRDIMDQNTELPPQGQNPEEKEDQKKKEETKPQNQGEVNISPKIAEERKALAELKKEAEKKGLSEKEVHKRLQWLARELKVEEDPAALTDFMMESARLFTQRSAERYGETYGAPLEQRATAQLEVSRVETAEITDTAIREVLDRLNTELVPKTGVEAQNILGESYYEIQSLKGVRVNQRDLALRRILDEIEKIRHQLEGEKYLKRMELSTEGLEGKAKDIIDKLNELTKNIGENYDLYESKIKEILDDTKINAGQKALAIEKINAARERIRIHSETERKSQRPGSLYAEKRLNEIEKQLLKFGTEEQEPEIEELFNRMFVRVDANPHEEFNKAFGTAGTIEWDEFTNNLGEALSDPNPAVRERAEKRRHKYDEEKKLREAAHNANYVVLINITVDKITEIMQGFTPSQLDLAFSKKGVAQAFRFYELALKKVQAKLGGYLTSSAVDGAPHRGLKGEVEILARNYLDEAVKMGIVEKMTQGEKDRAIALARGISIITGRTLEIAASSILPDEHENSHLISLYAQDIIKDLNPFRHSYGKFNAGQEGNAILRFAQKEKRLPQWFWNPEELRKFDPASKEGRRVINGKGDDGQERYFSEVNPFKIGGLFSKTTWRLGEGEITGSLQTLSDHDLRWDGIEDGRKDGIGWRGIGMTIEVERGHLNDDKKKNATDDDRERARLARVRIQNALIRAAKISPLKLFYNFRDVQEQILVELGKDLRTGLKEKELNEDLDWLIMLQQDALSVIRNEDYEDPEDPKKMKIKRIRKAEENGMVLDFNLITDPAQKARVENIANKIKGKFLGGGDRLTERGNKFIEDLANRDWKMPYNFGTDDTPFEGYLFEATGGSAIARRWRDISAERRANEALKKLVESMPSFKDPRQIIPALKEIFSAVSDYDGNAAKDVMRKLGEGVIKFYAKDWKAKLPFGIGTIVTIVKRTSYAQKVFGKGAMTWDEVDINDFTKLMNDAGLVDIRQQKELQRRTGGRTREAAAAAIRTFALLGMAAMMFFLIKQILSGEKK